MVIRITKLSRGGYDVAYGAAHAGGVNFGDRPGCTMPCFLAKMSSHADNISQVEFTVEYWMDEYGIVPDAIEWV